MIYLGKLLGYKLLGYKLLGFYPTQTSPEGRNLFDLGSGVFYVRRGPNLENFYRFFH
jgi:hypothetical protein